MPWPESAQVSKKVGTPNDMHGSTFLFHHASLQLATIQSIAWEIKILQGRVLGLLYDFPTQVWLFLP